MKPPPRYYPKNLDLQFAADPFDGRMRRQGGTHTPLGMVMEAWAWMKHHEADVPPAMKPIMESFYECLRCEAPDALAELETML